MIRFSHVTNPPTIYYVTDRVVMVAGGGEMGWRWGGDGAGGGDMGWRWGVWG